MNRNVQPEDDGQYVTFDAEPWLERESTRRLLRAGLVLLAIALIAGYPAWRAWQARRVDELTAEGVRFLQAGRLGDAFDRTSAGLRSRPSDLPLLRQLARIRSRAGSPEALDAWRVVLATPGATIEDRQSFIATALDLDRPQVAQPQLVNPLAATNPPPRFLALAVRHRLAVEEVPAALELARQLAAATDARISDLLEVAAALERRTDGAGADEARSLIVRACQAGGPERFEALQALIERPAATRVDREEAVRLLSAGGNGPRSTQEEVLLVDARMHLDPAQARARATNALASLRPGTDAELLSLVQCLQGHQLPDLALGLLTPDRIRDSLPLFRARLGALVGVGQMAAAYREADRARPQADPLEAELDRLWLAFALNDPANLLRHRTRAFQLAGRDPVRLRHLAEFAASHDMTEVAMAAWKPLSVDRLEGAHALRALSALADRAGDTWAARDHLRQLARLDPENPTLQLRLAHFDLLLGENARAALRTAEGLMERPDLRASARLIAADACLRLGERERARAHLGRLQLPGAHLPAPLRALLVSLLGATGSEGEARALADTLPSANLRPEERELIRPYLGAASTATP